MTRKTINAILRNVKVSVRNSWNATLNRQCSWHIIWCASVRVVMNVEIYTCSVLVYQRGLWRLLSVYVYRMNWVRRYEKKSDSFFKENKKDLITWFSFCCLHRWASVTSWIHKIKNDKGVTNSQCIQDYTFISLKLKGNIFLIDLIYLSFIFFFTIM